MTRVQKRLCWSMAAIMLSVAAYVGTGYAIFSEKYAVPTQDRIFRVQVIADASNRAGLDYKEGANLLALHGAMDDNDHALKDLFLAALKQEINKENLMPVPRWYHDGLDLLNGFQRTSWLHKIYPWMEWTERERAKRFKDMHYFFIDRGYKAF